MRRLLVCFDVDGTLIDDTVFIWQTLHERLDTDPVERKMWSDAYWNKKISYFEWASKDVEMWIRKSADRARIYQAISGLTLMAGARETLDTIRQDGHTLGIISGSLDIALEKTLPDYQTVFDHVFLNRLKFDPDNQLTGVIPTPYDIEHKATGLIEMAHRAGIDLRDTVFIGDNFNDIEVARIAGFSIAFNCKSQALSEVSDTTIPDKDLKTIIPLIRKFAQNGTDKS